jgi:hypothetical protein
VYVKPIGISRKWKLIEYKKESCLEDFGNSPFGKLICKGAKQKQYEK